MRSTVIALALVFVPLASAAQPSPCTGASSPGTLTFDPYKPSHLAIVRTYGGAVMSQATLGALLQLDPYAPSDGVLLRQVGNGIPAWGYMGWYPWSASPAPSAPCAPAAASASTETAPRPATAAVRPFAELLSTLDFRATRTTSSPATRVTSGPARGITVEYDGRIWVSSGAAVPLSETGFRPVGDRAGSPIYRQAGGDPQVIYIPTTPGMVAPFRVTR